MRSIATRSTGFDHVELEVCQARGILVSNVSSYGENMVAEHTFALILALSRNIHKAFVHNLAKEIPFQELRGFDLAGKTLGVLGAGRIGLQVIDIAKGFGMRVVAFDVRHGPLLAEILNFRYVPLDELLRTSDVISMHCLYSPKTHHTLDADNIRQVKHGALLINTAGGGLIDPAALARALDEGILAGAALDVLEGEELLKDERRILAHDKLRTLLFNHSPLNRDNVVITPHTAFDSREVVQRILEVTLENLRAYLRGQPRNLVTVQYLILRKAFGGNTRCAAAVAPEYATRAVVALSSRGRCLPGPMMIGENRGMRENPPSDVIGPRLAVHPSSQRPSWRHVKSEPWVMETEVTARGTASAVCFAGKAQSHGARGRARVPEAPGLSQLRSSLQLALADGRTRGPALTWIWRLYCSRSSEVPTIVELDAAVNLNQARLHSVLRIAFISGGWGVRRNLNQLGLHVGDEVSVVHKAPFGGPLVVENRGNRVAIGRRLAEKIGVEVLR